MNRSKTLTHIDDGRDGASGPDKLLQRPFYFLVIHIQASSTP